MSKEDDENKTVALENNRGCREKIIGAFAILFVFSIIYNCLKNSSHNDLFMGAWVIIATFAGIVLVQYLFR
ncbi:MAG: hypothetical protein A2020_12375 [Lentisphaerae bacterium GWF2_45_14]|nr:MAG: hypothetical protein A2020_12375 [Lentisphaerae bacterium GWF2_45_14]